MTRYWNTTKVTLIGKTQFTEPQHLPVEWVDEPVSDGERIAEYAGRICYMSQNNPAHRTTQEYLGNILVQGHGSVMEHANYTFLIEGVSRSLTHELVRHRAGFAYSQLSQRYVAADDTDFVIPPAIQGNVQAEAVLKEQCEDALRRYRALVTVIGDDTELKRKQIREAARSVLPNATETKIIVTANARAWRTMLEQRTAKVADAEIRRLALAVLWQLKETSPGLFQDFLIVGDESGFYATTSLRKV